jgi:CHASE2 domain-containing sensor protein
MTRYSQTLHAVIYTTLSFCLLYLLHLLPVNQLFIDPFSEAIKQHDVMDIAFSKFRNHDKLDLFDDKIIIINSGITDREELAKTINLVNDKGALAIGLDLILDTFYAKRSDTLLRDAMIRANGKLVLGYTLDEQANHITTSINENTIPFFSKGIKEAYVNLATNDGFSVRAYVPYIETEKANEIKTAFSTELANMLDSTTLNILKKRNHEFEWVNFKRIQPGERSMVFPINSKRNVHYIQIDIDKFIQDSSIYDSTFFQNKIVLIGFCGETQNSFSMNDRYFTPLNQQYTGRSLPDMFGVVIHANIISMLLEKSFINEVPHSIIYLICFLIFFINFHCFTFIILKFKKMQGFYIRLFQFSEFILLFCLAIVLLAFGNLKLGFFFIATSVVLSFELFTIYERELDKYFESWITRLRNPGEKVKKTPAK